MTIGPYNFNKFPILLFQMLFFVNFDLKKKTHLNCIILFWNIPFPHFVKIVQTFGLNVKPLLCTASLFLKKVVSLWTIPPCCGLLSSLRSHSSSADTYPPLTASPLNFYLDYQNKSNPQNVSDPLFSLWQLQYSRWFITKSRISLVELQTRLMVSSLFILIHSCRSVCVPGKPVCVCKIKAAQSVSSENRGW